MIYCFSLSVFWQFLSVCFTCNYARLLHSMRDNKWMNESWLRQCLRWVVPGHWHSCDAGRCSERRRLRTGVEPSLGNHGRFAHSAAPSITQRYTGWRKKAGRPSYLIANILKTPWPNCVEILQIFSCLLTHYSLLWWRHTDVTVFIYWNAAVVYSHCTNRYEHHTVACFRYSAMKFLNKNNNDWLTV